MDPLRKKDRIEGQNGRCGRRGSGVSWTEEGAMRAVEICAGREEMRVEERRGVRSKSSEWNPDNPKSGSKGETVQKIKEQAIICTVHLFCCSIFLHCTLHFPYSNRRCTQPSSLHQSINPSALYKPNPCQTIRFTTSAHGSQH